MKDNIVKNESLQPKVDIGLGDEIVQKIYQKEESAKL